MMRRRRRPALNILAKRLEPGVQVMVLTCTSFLLGSTGWLMWAQHLTELTSPALVDAHSMGMGYLMQAAGIAWFSLDGRNHTPLRLRRMTALTIGVSVVCLLPAVMLPGLAPTLAFGYLANLLCGFYQGYYLRALATSVERGRRGIVFGGAYAVSTVLGWALSALGNGLLVRGLPGFATCALLALLAASVASKPLPPLDDDATPEARPAPDRRLIAFSCLAVTLISLTKNAGFGFPTEDLLEGVSLESSRLFYGVGLVGAGLMSDRDRRYGALCCAGALVTPFLMPSLSGAAAPATILWMLGYLLFGFFSVFRVLLLSDLAAEADDPRWAGAGLAAGRVGDAAGTLLTIVLAGTPLALITANAVLFALTMPLFFVLYQQLYVPTPDATPSERELFERFATHHDLSARERDVLRLVLAEKSNSEIAGELFVSESTVKYHVRNLLRKTGCKTRLEILAKYAGQ